MTRDASAEHDLVAPRFRLFAAVYTPFDAGGDLRLDAIPPYLDRLLADGVDALYVCGSTGEGPSLTAEERRRIARAYVECAARRLPVIVQVGHNSLREAASLAAHAADIGADAVSATCPSYFPIAEVADLVRSMAEVARAAPSLPFYYYHIPSLTRVALDMPDFLRRAREEIPSLWGLKFTSPAIHELMACLDIPRADGGGGLDVLWGTDEMLASAAYASVSGAVGSTYNFAAPLYRRLLAAIEDGEIERAADLQALAVRLVRTLSRHDFLPASKALLGLVGDDFGGCRSPLGTFDAARLERLRAELDEIGYFAWGRGTASG